MQIRSKEKPWTSVRYQAVSNNFILKCKYYIIKKVCTNAINFFVFSFEENEAQDG